MYHVNLASLLVIAIASTGCLPKSTAYIPSYYGTEQNLQGTHQAALPDGALYKGEFKNGLFHGQGVLTWANGARYEGEFKNGLLNGQGELRSASGEIFRGQFIEGSLSGQGELELKKGDRYEGEFKLGQLHGQGKYTANSGEVYEGEFENGDFTGKGRITYDNGYTYEGDIVYWFPEGEGGYETPDGKKYVGHFVNGSPNGHIVATNERGDHYEGGMKGWDVFDGEGTLTLSNGDTYQGKFKDGNADGVFTITMSDGGRYNGELEEWLYDGVGVLTKADGERYKGSFSQGLYHGKGTLTFPDFTTYIGDFQYGQYHGEGKLVYLDDENKRQVISGPWQRGQYIGEDAADFVESGVASVNAERLFYQQPDMMDRALSKLTPQRPGETDLYFISFGGYGSQDVFMKEVDNSTSVMDQLYGTGDRSLKLVNNLKTVNQYPLASVINLQQALNGVADVMDKEEDVLFLYLTSHGSRDHVLSIELEHLPLQELPAKELKGLLDQADIKWKVILVSACYSGGFIDELKDDHSLVITAASADRTSFGCSNDADLTYFGRAFFKDALSRSSGFIEAFEKARQLVTERELADDFKPSNPQIASNEAIEAKLSELMIIQNVCDATSASTNTEGSCNK